MRSTMTNLDRAIGRMNIRHMLPEQDEEVNREIAASANRIDLIIAVFAFGVLFGMWIG